PCRLEPGDLPEGPHDHCSGEAVSPPGDVGALSLQPQPHVRGPLPRLSGGGGNTEAGLACRPPAPHDRLSQLDRGPRRGSTAHRGLLGRLPTVPREGPSLDLKRNWAWP